MSTPATDFATDREGRRRVAIALVALGRDRASVLLRSMDESSATLVANEIAELGPVDADEARAALRHLASELRAPSQLPAPGVGYAKEMLVSALGDERGGAAAARLDVPKPFAWLATADPEPAAKALAMEPPGAVALAIAHIPPSAGARLLTRLPDEMRVDVALRIAGLEAVHPATVDEVDRSLYHRIGHVVSAPTRTLAGTDVLARLLAKAGREQEQATLSALAKADPAMADQIRAAMFTFEDIGRLDDRAIQALLKSIETRDLALALVGAPEELSSRLLANLSSRARETLLEEIDVVTPGARKGAVKEARKRVVAGARRLEAAGELDLSTTEDE